MGSSSLAYLDRATAEAVDRQIENPGAFMGAQATKRIKGIAVVDNSVVDKRRLELDSYRDDAAEFRAALAKQGISVLAITPRPAWQAIARESGLLRFDPKEDGTVPASSQMLEEIGTKVHNILGARALWGLGIGGLATAGLFLAGALALGASLGVAFGLAAVAGVFGGYLAFKTVESFYFKNRVPRPNVLVNLERKHILAAFANRTPALMRKLWPGELKRGQTVDLKIEMPPAPPEAQQNLTLAHEAGYDLTLYAVPEAVSFLEDPAATFIKARMPVWDQNRAAYDRELALEAARRQAVIAERERRRREWVLNDPIVTIDHGSVTAIVVQYGDFPLEQEVIDRIVNSSDLL